jgi:hypothetical protein
LTTSPSVTAWRGELARVAFLGALAAWLLHPFATARMVGAGDAVWYAQMLADFTAQLRGGIFPVFVGQTEWAWNGAIYPLRVAPLYQHAGGLIDLLTGRQLDVFALQHAVVLASGVLGLLSAYIALRTVDPASPWRAAVLAALYLSCPGVLGTIYTQDLYMTWMVLPFLPLAWLGTVRTFERDDIPAQLLLAAGLAGAWLAHAPVALWLTLVLGSAQGFRLLTRHRTRAAGGRAMLGAAVFAVLGGYPFVSLAFLNASGAGTAAAGGLPHDHLIVQAVRDAFPRALLPVSAAARELGDLQLGYGLWLAAVVALGALAGRNATDSTARRTLPAFLLVASAGLLVLVLPVPALTEWLWGRVPGAIKRLTYYWPMHRFYLLLAILLAGAAHLALRDRARRGQAAGLILLGLGLAWSLGESRQFVRAGRERTASVAATERTLRPENRLLMTHAYGLFAALPDRFTHGATDPRAEFRLVDATGAPLRAADSGGPFAPATGQSDANPGILRLAPEITLMPGRRYALDFRFRSRDYAGILQLSGATFFREYQLPRSGSERGFGSAAGASPTVHLWTTASAPERITLRFIPTDGAKPEQFRDFGELRLREISAESEPVRVREFAPLRVEVRSPVAATLATPRMMLAGYRVTIDGTPAPFGTAGDGTLQVPVPPGEHVVAIDYAPPTPVALAYYLGLLGWAGLCAGAAIRALAGVRRAAQT